MSAAIPQPIRSFEHSHAHLNELAREIGRLLRLDGIDRSEISRKALSRLTAELQEELLAHFANEEEGLFPFVRERLPAEATVVDRLAAGHDAICGAVVRLAHLASREQLPVRDAVALFERFEAKYGAHSREEAELFDRLERELTREERLELAEHLRGLE